MTREEAIHILKQYNLYSPTRQIEEAIDMSIEALSADAVSREEYTELYNKAKEVNKMANDILADFPSYEEFISVVRCKDCRHRDLFSCPLADNDFQKDEDFCSWGERR